MSSHGPSRVFVDSNVLYSRTLRDWLCLLSIESDMPPFLIYWSEDVLAEAIYHLRKDHPTWDGGRIARVRESLTASLEGGQVRDFRVDESYTGGDTHDAHVHAAATACAAHYLLTCNVRHFDDSQTCYEVIDPDSFFLLMHDSTPSLVDAVTSRQMKYWAKTREDARLPHYLDAAGCPRFAHVIRTVLARMGGLPLPLQQAAPLSPAHHDDPRRQGRAAVVLLTPHDQG